MFLKEDAIEILNKLIQEPSCYFSFKMSIAASSCEEYPGDGYDLFRRNCCHFADDFTRRIAPHCTTNLHDCRLCFLTNLCAFVRHPAANQLWKHVNKCVAIILDV